MTAAELVASKKHILLDFDGPICAAFAGYGASNISRQLAILLAQSGVRVPGELVECDDPFSLLRYAADLGDPELLGDVDAEFRRLEFLAVRIAIPAPGAVDTIHALDRAGKTVTIVSNNSGDAVESYARRHRIMSVLAGICARSSSDPSLLKPNPHLILSALQARNSLGAEAVMVGDSVSDIQAAHAAGTGAIALANKPGKITLLKDQTPEALITDIRKLTNHQG